MRINEYLYINENELTERFVRASGPGGQHVNKVATAVQLHFDASQSATLPETVRRRLLAMRNPHISPDGSITITARRFRSQARNRTDARQRLAQLIDAAWQPQKKRRPTRPPKRAKEKRLKRKKQQAKTKGLRKTPPAD